MLDQLSINMILKTVIAALSAVVVVMLASGAWSSWQRLQVETRIAGVAATADHVFTALHNLRSDRTRSYRMLMSDERVATRDPRLWEARDAEMPALKGALATLETLDFPGREAVVTELAQRIKKLTALHEESVAAMTQPKSARRAGLAPEIRDEATALITMLDSLSTRLDRLIRLEDAFIDQLMEIKQLGWIVRDSAGDASVMISNTLSGQPLPADPFVVYTRNVSKHETAWAMLERQVAGLTLPESLKAAIAKAKQEYMGPDFVNLRANTFKKLIAGEPAGITIDQWSSISVPKLATLLKVSTAALDVAKEHAAAQQSAAKWKLWSQLGMLAAAIAFAIAMMLLVSRRVVAPLHRIQGAMLKLAGGDFGVVVPGIERKDEVGAMANAVERFKVVADEKARHEAEEATRRQQAETALQAKSAEERAAVAEEQAHAFRALAEGLGKLAAGDLTYRLGDDFPDEYKEIRDDFNRTIAQLQDTIRAIASATREVASTAAEISSSTTDLSQRTEEQAASLEQTSASMEEISATVKKNAENAQQANQFAGGTREVADRGGEVVAQAVERDGADRGLLAQDLRHHRRDRRDRAPDQPAGAQRGGRGGARRRGGPRLRGGGLRGAQPGAALVAGRQGHQGPDHQQLGPGAGGRRAGQPGRRLAERDRGLDQEGGRDRVGHRDGQRRAVDRHRPGQHRADPDGRGDAAELGAGRAERRRRQGARAAVADHGRVRHHLPARHGAGEGARHTAMAEPKRRPWRRSGRPWRRRRSGRWPRRKPTALGAVRSVACRPRSPRPSRTTRRGKSSSHDELQNKEFQS